MKYLLFQDENMHTQKKAMTEPPQPYNPQPATCCLLSSSSACLVNINRANNLSPVKAQYNIPLPQYVA